MHGKQYYHNLVTILLQPCHHLVHCTQPCYSLVTISSKLVQPCHFYMGGSGLRYTNNHRLLWSLNFSYYAPHRHSTCCTVYRRSAASGSPHDDAYVFYLSSKQLQTLNVCIQSNAYKKSLCLNETWSSEYFLVM